jgi:hypothetical protein
VSKGVATDLRLLLNSFFERILSWVSLVKLLNLPHWNIPIILASGAYGISTVEPSLPVRATENPE